MDSLHPYGDLEGSELSLLVSKESCMRPRKERIDHAVISMDKEEVLILKVMEKNESLLTLIELLSPLEADRMGTLLASLGVPVYAEDKNGHRYIMQ